MYDINNAGERKYNLIHSMICMLIKSIYHLYTYTYLIASHLLPIPFEILHLRHQKKIIFLSFHYLSLLLSLLRLLCIKYMKENDYIKIYAFFIYDLSCTGAMHCSVSARSMHSVYKRLQRIDGNQDDHGCPCKHVCILSLR